MAAPVRPDPDFSLCSGASARRGLGLTIAAAVVFYVFVFAIALKGVLW